MGERGQQVIHGEGTGDPADQDARAEPLQLGGLDHRRRTDQQHLSADLREQVLLTGLVRGLVQGAFLGVLRRLPLGPQRLAVLGAPRLACLPRLLGGLGRLQHGLALPLGALTGQLAQRRAGGAAQRDRLEQRQAVGDRVRAEHLDGRGHRALGADPQTAGGQQLGDVHPQHEIAGRDLAAAQLGQHDSAGTIHQQRVPDQPPVRDPPGLERLDLPPGAVHQRVGDLLVGQRVEGPAADVLVDQHHRVRAELGGGDQLRGMGTGRDRRIRQQRLLLQRLAQRLETAALVDAAQREPAPHAVEEAVRLLLAVDDGDIDRRAVLQGDEVAAAAVGMLGRVRGGRVLRTQRGDRVEADPAQPR